MLSRSGSPALPRGGRMTIVRNCSLRNSRPWLSWAVQRRSISPERDRRLRAEVDLDAAADQMMVEDRLGIERAAQHDVAHREQVVEDLIVLGLEREAGETHRAHQRTVAQAQRRGIDVAGIRKRSPARASFLFHAAGPNHLAMFEAHPLSWRVAVAAPALPIPGARAAADFGDPQIEDPRLAEAGEIADHVHRKRDGKREIRCA